MGFYDGFETGSLDSNYVNNDGTGQYTIITSPAPPANYGTYALQGYRNGGGGETTRHIIFRTDVTISPPITLTYWLQRSGTHYGSCFLFGGSSGPYSYQCRCGSNLTTKWVGIERNNGGLTNALKTDITGSTMGTSVYNAFASGWVRIQITWGSDGAFELAAFDINGTSLGTPDTGNDTTYTGGGFGWGVENPNLFSSSTTQYYDAKALSMDVSLGSTIITSTGVSLYPLVLTNVKNILANIGSAQSTFISPNYLIDKIIYVESMMNTGAIAYSPSLFTQLQVLIAQAEMIAGGSAVNPGLVKMLDALTLIGEIIDGRVHLSWI